jgi:transcription-repair coupling factor (superfamily II helicase)
LSLSDLLDVVSADPSLARALQTPTAPALDLTGPSGLRPFVLAGLVRRGRTVLAVTATGREAEDLVAALSTLLDGNRVGPLPQLGDAAARATVPAGRHVGAAWQCSGRLAHPQRRRPGDRARSTSSWLPVRSSPAASGARLG